MEDSSTTRPDLKSFKETRKENQPSKKRWVIFLFFFHIVLWVILEDFLLCLCFFFFVCNLFLVGFFFFLMFYRKVVEKTVVTVKIEENTGKQKGEGPPSDFWSWRKYGQKPIKGSPYPR